MPDAEQPPARPRRWRRARKILRWIVGLLAGVPLVLVAALLVLFNTSFGRHLIVQQTASLTGGTVRLFDLHGTFPQALRLGRLELIDAKGVWFSANDVALDWSPTALLGGVFSAQKLAAASVAMARLPVPGPAKTGSKASSGFSLPVSVRLQSLDVPRAEIGAAVAGAPAVLRLAGSANVASLQHGSIALTVTRLDFPGEYTLHAALAANGGVDGRLELHEPPHGLVETVAKLPNLGALAIDAAIVGPKQSERATLRATAGPLRAAANGSIDLAAKQLALDLDVDAPSMRPGPGIAWQSVAIHAHAHGPWTAPEASGHVAITQLQAEGVALATLTAELSGNRGAAHLAAELTGLRIPGSKPNLFAAAPIALTADADLAAPERTLRFRVAHPLLAADGVAHLGAAPSLDLTASVPDLAPLAAAGGAQLAGHAQVSLRAARSGSVTDARLDSTLDITGGQAPVPALLGKATIRGEVQLAGQRLTIRSLAVDGSDLHADLAGTKADTLNFAWHLAIADLAPLAPDARGGLRASGQVRGPLDGFAVDADLDGTVGTRAMAPGPLTASLHATGLPKAPVAALRASGRVAGSDLRLQANVQREPKGGLAATISEARWKSVTADANLQLAPGALIPLGDLHVRIAQLADLDALSGQKLAGGLTASLVSRGDPARPETRIDVEGRGLGAAGSGVERLAITGTVTGADSDPDLDIGLVADGVSSGAISGRVRATAKGRANALALDASTVLHHVAGADLEAATSAVLDAKAKSLRLRTLTADAHGIAARLAAPCRIDFGKETKIDRLRLAVGDASVALSGELSPALDLTASLRNVTPSLAKPFVPALNAQGVLSADAQLHGTTAAPTGTVRVAALGLRVLSGPGASLPAANARLRVDLHGKSAGIDAHVDAGPKLRLAAGGTAPLGAGGALDIRTSGALDLTLLDPILQAGGRRAQGRLALDVTATGPVGQPDFTGSATLSGGEVQDYVQGLHLTNMAARIRATGKTIELASFSADAAPGTITASGTVGLAAPMPVDIHLRAQNARPLASDLLTATIDADLAVQGQMQGKLDAGGQIKVRRADIHIPDSFPPSVAVLNVRRAGQKPPPPAPPAPPSVVALGITVDAPQAIFVRGHGLDAELGGRLKVAGTVTAPQISGGFQMRRGQFSLAGTTLDFTQGEVGFNGAGVTGKIDPTINFVAESSQGGITATLTITGYADAPKIGLSSLPELPQDEVLAHLLFGQSMSSLSPLQIAEIGAALAEISGVTGGGGGPLSSIRKGLGLDRLSVGGGTNGAGASVEAGRYVARGVYVGAKQATSGGGGTQAQVQIDLTRRLKLDTQFGTGGSTQGATPQNDPGSYVGLSYQFEY